MTSTLVVCPSCGAENTGTRFCEACGAPAPSLAPVQPAGVGVSALSAPGGAARIDRGALHEMALRALAVGPVALVFLPALTGSILALLGGLDGYVYEFYGLSSGTYLFLSGLWLAWPLTLILAVLVAGAGALAAVTADRPTSITAAVIGLSVVGAALLAFWTWGWVPGGVAFAAAWILLARLRGWAYYALFVPLVTGILAVVAISAANAHILVAAFLLGLLAAATAAGVLVLGRYLSRLHALQPPKPPPAPRAAPPQPGYPTAASPSAPPMPGQVVPGQVVAGPMMTGPVVPMGTVVVPGYAPGYAPGYLMPQRRTNGFAVASFVLGLLGFSVLAVIFGHVALVQTRRTGDGGRGLAVAGLVLGYIWLALGLAYLVFAIVTLVIASSYSSMYYF